ncbi:MAG: hypothetical protein N3A61_00970 [Ignavibacteria bacterium]|nr:hypothetical protein [Ignavibacteria bacterium]
MEPKIFEKLITDLKNLPKTKAPENLEQELLRRINQDKYSEKKSIKEKLFHFNIFKEPIFATVAAIVLVFILVLSALESNENQFNTVTKVFEKAVPSISESSDKPVLPLKNKIALTQKKIAQRTKQRSNEPLPFQIGAGTNLDQLEVSKSTVTDETNSFGIETGFPNEPVQIRIPPPARLNPNILIEEERALKSTIDSISKGKNKKKSD